MTRTERALEFADSFVNNTSCWQGQIHYAEVVSSQLRQLKLMRDEITRIPSSDLYDSVHAIDELENALKSLKEGLESKIERFMREAYIDQSALCEVISAPADYVWND